MALQRRLLPAWLLTALFVFPGFRPAFGQGASTEPAQEVLEHFRAGQQDMQAGRFRDAIGEFKRVLQLRPDLVEPRVNLGLAYHAAGDYSLAASELEGVVRQRADLVPANLFLGLSYLKLGSPERAIRPLDRVLALDASNREARRALATVELAQEEYGRAAGQFRKLAASYPDKANALFTLGRDYLQISKRLSGQLSSQFRDSAWAHRLAGDILSERRLWNDAAFAYRKALLVDPAQPGLHSALAEILLRQGKIAESESEFKLDISRDPFEPSALLGLAKVKLVKGQWQAALDQITLIGRNVPELLLEDSDFPDIVLPVDAARRMATAVEGSPPSPAREFVLSALFAASGDAVGARQRRLSLAASAASASSIGRDAAAPSRSACARHQERLCADFLSSRKPLRFEDALRLGRALSEIGQEEPASDAFAAAFQQNKRSAETIYWLNRSYLRLADTCFDQLNSSYPDSWQTHELKAQTFHLRQKEKEAVAEYRAAERLRPDEYEIHEALGEILLQENQAEEAKSELQSALRLNPAAARSLYLLGRLYVSQRDPASGIPYLEAALRYDPTLVEARPVLGKAYLKVGRPELAASQLEQSSAIDRYGDLHYLLYQAYSEGGKRELAARALARSQELRRKSAADDQRKVRPADEE